MLIELLLIVIYASIWKSLFCELWWWRGVSGCHHQGEFEEELGVLSILARDVGGSEYVVRGRCKCLVTAGTIVTFIAKRYRVVFVLDISPSVATIVSRGRTDRSASKEGKPANSCSVMITSCPCMITLCWRFSRAAGRLIFVIVINRG